MLDPGRCLNEIDGRMVFALALLHGLAALVPSVGPESTATSEPAMPAQAPESPETAGGATLPDIERPEPEERAIEVTPDPRDPSRPERSSSVVTREDMERRLPRSTPDALRYEPGVHVQQTAHAQASPYLRGLTGQQTVMQFDGIRLNNSTFRQGPNQYFFLVDSKTVRRLEVVRGSASTLYGSDALGGVMLATPVEPTFDADRSAGHNWSVHPTFFLAARSADQELGGRGELDISWRNVIGIRGGAGYRDVGQLKAAGPIIEPATGKPYLAPRFEGDGKTQRGTGFREFTADARLVARLSDKFRLTAAYYDYRQKDAPRTDRCPASQAPEDSCEIYLDQFRTMVYVAMDGEHGPPAAQTQRYTVSFQRQHEHRFSFSDNGIPLVPGGVENHGADDVDTFGATASWATRSFDFGRNNQFGFDAQYGADAYHDRVHSLAWQNFTDYQPPEVRWFSRGQYVDGSNYLGSGVFAQLRLRLFQRLRLHGGARLALVVANSPGDARSNSSPVDGLWAHVVGNFGFELWTTNWMTVFGGVDQGFRAPNLDDLTSRQQTGPGYQFENANLEPERSLAFELGARVQHQRVRALLSVYQTNLLDSIVRAPRDVCPSEIDGCLASRTRFQLVNSTGLGFVRGVDASVRVEGPWGLGLLATLSYAFGETPNPALQVADATTMTGARVPMSRIPPLNGVAELSWRSSFGLWLGGGLRWAGAQDRLAPTDIADIRIPAGGTPGFAVVDLHAGYRVARNLMLALVFENIANTAYRQHGSSINGAARSLSGQLVAGF